MDKVFLVDAYSQIFRCFYAIRTRLSNSEGQPTNAVYGIARLLLQLDQTMPTTYGAICFDKGKCTRRCELLPEYKAQRPPMPEDLRCQVEPIKEWMEAFGWKRFEEPGLEADDLVAAITRAAKGCEVSILTGDKDLAQLLVQDHVRLVQGCTGGEWLETHRENVMDKFGVPAELLGDYLALVGDTADNIKGVPGVGPKTAAKLLLQYGGIDGIQAHVNELRNGRMKDSLAASDELLERNRKLVALGDELPSAWTGLEGMVRRQPDWDRLIAMSENQGFKSLIKSLEQARKTYQQPTLF